MVSELFKTTIPFVFCLVREAWLRSSINWDSYDDVYILKVSRKTRESESAETKTCYKLNRMDKTATAAGFFIFTSEFSVSTGVSLASPEARVG